MTNVAEKISILIPVYNEGPHLREFLSKFLAIKFPFAIEIVIVDDCSTDGSWEIIEEFAKKSPLNAHRQDVNRGKGATLRKGFAIATGSIIAIQDADFEYDPVDLIALVQPILDDKADVVYGSRFRQTSPQIHRTFHYLINRFLTMFSNFLSGLYLTDMETCYKIFRADMILALVPRFESNRFGFEPEVTAAIAKTRSRVHEYPISYFPRGYSQGKKINWKDGVAALWFIIKFNLRGLPVESARALPEKYRLVGGRLF